MFSFSWRIISFGLGLLSVSQISRAKEHADSKGMRFLAGGEFIMGCNDCGLEDAEPVHKVKLSPFYIDKTPVTNAEFARFVTATGYKTIAERRPDPKEFPQVPKENLVAGSIVFSPPARIISLNNPYAWWEYQADASWWQPEGPASSDPFFVAKAIAPGIS